jgi:hypothetical protein
MHSKMRECSEKKDCSVQGSKAKKNVIPKIVTAHSQGTFFVKQNHKLMALPCCLSVLFKFITVW